MLDVFQILNNENKFDMFELMWLACAFGIELQSQIEYCQCNIHAGRAKNGTLPTF